MDEAVTRGRTTIISVRGPLGQHTERPQGTLDGLGNDQPSQHGHQQTQEGEGLLDLQSADKLLVRE